MIAVQDDGAAVLARARARLPEHLDLLASLVEVDTRATCATAATGLVPVERALAALGFDSTRVAATADGVTRMHLVADRAPRMASATSRRLVVVGHVDTVLPGGPNMLRRDGEVWRGPGVIDMKGGVVTALLALGLADDARALDGIHVRVALCADEEIGSPTGRNVMHAAARGAEAVLCFEAARECGGLVVARKGLGVARLTARGRTGHAGLDHDRAPNAFGLLCKLVARAEALEKTLAVTVSPGGHVVSSPSALNAIPDHASCEVEWRFFDADAGDRVLEELNRIADELVAESGGELVVEGAVEVPPMSPSAATFALLARYQAAAAELGWSVTGTRTAGVGDINELAALGPVCLDGVGPEGGGMHTFDEWLELDSIARRAAMNALAITSWCREPARDAR